MGCTSSSHATNNAPMTPASQIGQKVAGKSQQYALTSVSASISNRTRAQQHNSQISSASFPGPSNGTPLPPVRVPAGVRSRGGISASGRVGEPPTGESLHDGSPSLHNDNAQRNGNGNGVHGRVDPTKEARRRKLMVIAPHGNGTVSPTSLGGLSVDTSQRSLNFSSNRSLQFHPASINGSVVAPDDGGFALMVDSPRGTNGGGQATTSSPTLVLSSSRQGQHVGNVGVPHAPAASNGLPRTRAPLRAVVEAGEHGVSHSSSSAATSQASAGNVDNCGNAGRPAAFASLAINTTFSTGDELEEEGDDGDVGDGGRRTNSPLLFDKPVLVPTPGPRSPGDLTAPRAAPRSRWDTKSSGFTPSNMRLESALTGETFDDEDEDEDEDESVLAGSAGSAGAGASGGDAVQQQDGSGDSHHNRRARRSPFGGGLGLALRCSTAPTVTAPPLDTCISLPIDAGMAGVGRGVGRSGRGRGSSGGFGSTLGLGPALNLRPLGFSTDAALPASRPARLSLFTKSHSTAVGHRPEGPIRRPLRAPRLAAAALDRQTIYDEFDAISLLPSKGEVSPSFRMSTQNRHRMFPFTHTVVRLESERYVNASHIEVPNFPHRRYVAAMGPLAKTVGPFWTMVWETQASTIAMLTKEKEGRRDKCYRYWPELGGEVLQPADAGVSVEAVATLADAMRACGGNDAAVGKGAAFDRLCTDSRVRVWDDGVDGDETAHDATKAGSGGGGGSGAGQRVNELSADGSMPSARRSGRSVLDLAWSDEGPGDGIIVRHFILRHVGEGACEGPTRVVTQLHMISWPDKTAPVTPAATLLLRRLSLARHNIDAPAAVAGTTPVSRPLLAHCSAGVGRTGTFIALDRLLTELEVTAASGGGERAVQGLELDVPGTVCDLRASRACMVYTPEQYEFIYRTVAHEVQRHLMKLQRRAAAAAAATQ